MDLCQPYYIEKRNSAMHVSLNGNWQFCGEEAECADISNLVFPYESTMPKSVYLALHEAGVLPHPYYGTNSKQYHWVDECVWYFRKEFVLTRPDFVGNAFLCFDGVSYYTRVWLNGKLLGSHEGMFGGPCCDVRDCLNLSGKNELIVEIKASNFGKKEGYDNWNRDGKNREIVPWNIARDSFTSNGDFYVIGLWNEIRLELLPQVHLSRPYLYTESVNADEAVLRFEVQIADGRVQELRPFFGITEGNYTCTRAYDSGLNDAVLNETVTVKIEIADGESVAYQSEEEVPLTDFEHLYMLPEYCEMQFYRKKIILSQPKRWYPNGMGEPFLYDVRVSVMQNGQTMDTHHFKFGVRTVETSETMGNKYGVRWNKFLFQVNGKPMFLKGMNWMPIDYLYDISPERYEWCLNLVKNAGIQLLRVWNGGGMPETDRFYELCDKFGIMVWQDLHIANTKNVENYPQDVLEAQTAYNLYRTRNHPSLVLLCGGNEFNPYKTGVAAAMFVMQRTVQTLTPDRIFHYTTADQGSAHIYCDMEPVWYRHRYNQLPFLGESGIHSFPNYRTIRKFISEKEATARIPDLSSPVFKENFPDLLNHFTEYLPSRVPRMTSRISQIIDMQNTTLAEICEASQVQVYEFYQLMIQSMQENYPVCGGIMPWVFKRSWTTVGIQTVDGDDQPCYGYYAIQNSYRPIQVCWCQEWSVLAPREILPLRTKVFNQNGADLSDTEICLTVYRPDMGVYAEYCCPYSASADFGILQLDDLFTDTCFLVCADLRRQNTLLSRSVYFNKCTSQLADEELYRKYRTAPTENLYFKQGPWLKPTIQQAKAAVLTAEKTAEGTEGAYAYVEILIRNISDVAAYPVTVELPQDGSRFFLSENFFMLKPHEEKTVRVTCDRGGVQQATVHLWNGKAVTV